MKDTVESLEFLNRAKQRETDFTRERRMPFCDVIYFMCGSFIYLNDMLVKKFEEEDGDIATYRGYPSFELFHRLEENGQKYLMRVQSNFMRSDGVWRHTSISSKAKA